MKNNDCSKLEKLAVKAENLAKENFTKDKIHLLFPHIIRLCGHFLTITSILLPCICSKIKP